MQLKRIIESDLSQSSQTSRIEFGLATVKGKSVNMSTCMFRCRDYITDALIGSKYSRDFEQVYGFKYDRKNPLDTKSTTLLVKIFNIKKLNNGINILNAIELEAGLELTTATKVESDKISGLYLFTGDKRWMDNSVNMAAYTLIIRHFDYEMADTFQGIVDLYHTKEYEDGKKSCTDRSTWRQGLTPEFIIKYIRLIPELSKKNKWPTAKAEVNHMFNSTYGCHNTGGIYSLHRYYSGSYKSSSTYFNNKLLEAIPEGW